MSDGFMDAPSANSPFTDSDAFFDTAGKCLIRGCKVDDFDGYSDTHVDAGFMTGESDYEGGSDWAEEFGYASTTSSDDYAIPSRHSPGVCNIIHVEGHTALMSGTWKCTSETVPTDSLIFREYRRYIEIEGYPRNLITDPPIELPTEFRFYLTEDGKKKFIGRRQFISLVGEIVLFD